MRDRWTILRDRFGSSKRLKKNTETNHALWNGNGGSDGKQMGKMEVAQLKMVRWALGVTRKDKIKNDYVRGTAKIAKLGGKLRNARLRWYGHIKSREEDYVGKRMVEIAVPGVRKRGRPRRRWMDLVREDMERVGAREGDKIDRMEWRLLSRCSDPE